MEVWLVGFFLGGAILLTWAMIRIDNARAETDRLKKLAGLDRLSAREGRLRND